MLRPAASLGLADRACPPALPPPPRRLGYRTASTEKNEPLYFLMVHQKIEDGP